MKVLGILAALLVGYLFYVLGFYILLSLLQWGGLDIDFSVWVGGLLLIIIHTFLRK